MTEEWERIKQIFTWACYSDPRMIRMTIITDVLHQNFKAPVFEILCLVDDNVSLSTIDSKIS